jgi:hypothetical protein
MTLARLRIAAKFWRALLRFEADKGELHATTCS